MEMNKARTLTRRNFLATAGFAAPSFLLLPSRAKGANARVRVGVIGCGRMGMEHIRSIHNMGMGDKAEVTAVSDLLESRRRLALRGTRGHAYEDWRELLSGGAVDAVVVAAPDHWHARMSIEAMRQGLDVYCETPMALTALESKEMLEAGRETKRILQIGIRTLLDPKWSALRTALEQEGMGSPRWCQMVSLETMSSGLAKEEGISPAQWKAFHGKDDDTPVNARRFHHWRNYWSYSMGWAAAWHYENLAGLLVALARDFPERVSAAGGSVGESEGETPDVLMASIGYSGDVQVTLISPGPKLPRVSWIRCEGGSVVIEGDRVKVEREGGIPKEVKTMEQPKSGSLLKEWLEVVRMGRSAVFAPELGHAAQAAISMSVQALQEGKTFCYDPDNAAIRPSSPRA